MGLRRGKEGTLEWPPGSNHGVALDFVMAVSYILQAVAIEEFPSLCQVPHRSPAPVVANSATAFSPNAVPLVDKPGIPESREKRDS